MSDLLGVELEFLEIWLHYAAEPIGQECCGRGGSRSRVATELLRQYARIQELEAHIAKLTTWKNEGELEIRAWDTMKEQERKIIELEKMLEAVGAGGVSAQRVTKAKWTGTLRGEDCKHEVFDDGVKTMIPRNPVFVRITHIPTGVTVECRDDERSSHRNSANAWLMLEAKLKEKKKLDFSSDPAEDRIEQPIEMVAAQETNGLLARIEKEISAAQINNHRMAAKFGKMEGEPCVRISSLLATIGGFLNEATDEQTAAPVVRPENLQSNSELATIVRELCAAYGHPLPDAALARSDAAIAAAKEI